MTDQEPLRVLVVDDDRLARVSTVKELEAVGYHAQGAESAYQALQMLEEGEWDVVLSDLRMPGMDGLDLLREVKQRWPAVEVVMMTAFGTVANAVQALREGAFDYLLKPYEIEDLDLRLRKLARTRSAERELARLRGLLDEAEHPFGLVGRSPQAREIVDRIRAFADNDAPVLITGETGTGKELVSRALHRASARADREFVAVGCGTIPRDLAESELFGHEKGSFTGAHQARPGSFERADGGTLLLDDVDDLPLDIQVKLLRAVQEGTLTRVGGTREIRVDVRVIATTKVDLDSLVREGKFRPDLFYRLRGLEIRLAPLRERGDDVLLLAEHFLRIASAGSGAVKSLSPEAAQILRAYPWPGNVRELQRAMEAACVMARGDVIEPSALPQFLRSTGQPDELVTIRLEGREEVPFNDIVREVEKQLLEWALRVAGGKQSEAARRLGLPRTTFQSKVESLLPEA